MPPALRRTLLWALAYGALGFAAGFAFGALRELLLIPAFGDRTGHLLEFPVVTGAGCAIGVWTGGRSKGPAFAIGVLGVLVLIAFESTMALGIMRVSLADYLAGYDLTRGALFPVGLALMAFAPVIGRKFSRR